MPVPAEAYAEDARHLKNEAQIKVPSHTIYPENYVIHPRYTSAVCFFRIIPEKKQQERRTDIQAGILNKGTQPYRTR